MASCLENVSTLVERAETLFREKFGYDPSVVVRSPGRVNLIGDHVDYNGGFVLPMAIPLATVCVGSLNNLQVCRVLTDSKIEGIDEPRFIEFCIPTLCSPLTPGLPKWANYVKGVIATGFQDLFQGFDCVFTSSIPVGAGLSSSAAIETATYTLLEELMENKANSLVEKALNCQKAEHSFAGCPCGIMDQYVCCHAISGCALLLDCKSIESRHVPLDDPNICVLVINSGVKHELSGSEYPLRRSQCERAAQVLGDKFLRDVTREKLEAHKDSLEEEVFRRALHVVNETEYTLDFVKHLEAKNYLQAGNCMLKSHTSLSDLFNVSCVEIDILVEISKKVDGVYGARMTGGGFGGCVVALVEEKKADLIIESISESCKSQNIFPTFYNCSPCDGVRRLR